VEFVQQSEEWDVFPNSSFHNKKISSNVDVVPIISNEQTCFVV
jgi:hypothetical protein